MKGEESSKLESNLTDIVYREASEELMRTRNVPDDLLRGQTLNYNTDGSIRLYFLRMFTALSRVMDPWNHWKQSRVFASLEATAKSEMKRRFDQDLHVHTCCQLQLICG